MKRLEGSILEERSLDFSTRITFAVQLSGRFDRSRH